MKLKFLAAVGLAATLYSCDDTTTGVGEFVADADEITASAQTFEATTKTLKYTDLYHNQRHRELLLLQTNHSIHLVHKHYHDYSGGNESNYKIHSYKDLHPSE